MKFKALAFASAIFQAICTAYMQPVRISPQPKDNVLSAADYLYLDIGKHVQVQGILINTSIFYSLGNPSIKGVSLISNSDEKKGVELKLEGLSIYDTCYLSIQYSYSITATFYFSAQICRKANKVSYLVLFQLDRSQLLEGKPFLRSFEITSSTPGIITCLAIRHDHYGGGNALCEVRNDGQLESQPPNGFVLLVFPTSISGEIKKFEIIGDKLKEMEIDLENRRTALSVYKWNSDKNFLFLIYKKRYTEFEKTLDDRIVLLLMNNEGILIDHRVLTLTQLLPSLRNTGYSYQISFANLEDSRLSISLIALDSADRGVMIMGYISGQLSSSNLDGISMEDQLWQASINSGDLTKHSLRNCWGSDLGASLSIITHHTFFSVSGICRPSLDGKSCLKNTSHIFIEDGLTIDLSFYSKYPEQNFRVQRIDLGFGGDRTSQVIEIDDYTSIAQISRNYISINVYENVLSNNPRIFRKWMIKNRQYAPNEGFVMPFTDLFFDLEGLDLSLAFFTESSELYILKSKGNLQTLTKGITNPTLEINGALFEGNHSIQIRIHDGRKTLSQFSVNARKVNYFEEAGEIDVPRFEIQAYTGEWAELPFSQSNFIAQNPKINISGDIESTVVYSNTLKLSIPMLATEAQTSFDKISPLGQNYYFLHFRSTLKNMMQVITGVLFKCEWNVDRFRYGLKGDATCVRKATLNKPLGFQFIEFVMFGKILVVLSFQHFSGSLHQDYYWLDDRYSYFLDGPYKEAGVGIQDIRGVNSITANSTLHIYYNSRQYYQPMLKIFYYSEPQLQNINQFQSLEIAVAPILRFTITETTTTIYSVLVCLSSFHLIDGIGDDSIMIADNHLCPNYYARSIYPIRYTVKESDRLIFIYRRGKGLSGGVDDNGNLRFVYDLPNRATCASTHGAIFWSRSMNHIIAYAFPDSEEVFNADSQTSRYEFNLDQHGIAKLIKMNCISTKSFAQFFGTIVSGKKVIINLNLAALEHSGRRIHSIVEVDDDVIDIESLNTRGGELFETVLIREQNKLLEGGVTVYVFNVKGPHVYVKTPNKPSNMTININVKTGVKETVSQVKIQVEDAPTSPIVKHRDEVYLKEERDSYPISDLFEIEGPISKIKLEDNLFESSLRFTPRVSLFESSGFNTTGIQVGSTVSYRDWVLGTSIDKSRVFIFKSKTQEKRNLKQIISYPDLEHDIAADRTVHIEHASFVTNTPSDLIVVALAYYSQSEKLQLAFLTNKEDTFDIDKVENPGVEFEQAMFTMVDDSTIYFTYISKKTLVITRQFVRVTGSTSEKRVWQSKDLREIWDGKGNIRSICTTSHRNFIGSFSKDDPNAKSAKSELHIFLIVEGEEEIRTAVLEVYPQALIQSGIIDPFEAPISGMPMLVHCYQTLEYGRDRCFVDSNGGFAVVIELKLLEKPSRKIQEGILFEPITTMVLRKPNNMTALSISMNEDFIALLMNKISAGSAIQESTRIILIYKVVRGLTYSWAIISDREHPSLSQLTSLGLANGNLLYIPSSKSYDPIEGHLLKEASIYLLGKGFKWGAQRVRFIGINEITEQSQILPFLKTWPDKQQEKSISGENMPKTVPISWPIVLVALIFVLTLGLISVFLSMRKRKIFKHKDKASEDDTGIGLL